MTATTQEPATASVETQCAFSFRKFLPRRMFIKNAASGKKGIKR